LSKDCHLFTPILKEITRYRIVAKSIASLRSNAFI